MAKTSSPASDVATIAAHFSDGFIIMAPPLTRTFAPSGVYW
ncbi:MAG: hypothetical protein ACLQOO_35920 [Terriglobia bacterium]